MVGITSKRTRWAAAFFIPLVAVALAVSTLGASYAEAGELQTSSDALSVAVEKKAVLVIAKDQTVSLNGSIETSSDKAMLLGEADGDILADFTLAPSSTETPTTMGTITPSDAKITRDGVDVTDDYVFTYAPGNLTVADDNAGDASVAIDQKDILEGRTNNKHLF